MPSHLFATENLSPEDYHALVIYEGTRILQTIAWEEIHRNNRQPEEFILFCVEGDSSWGNLVSEVDEKEEWRKVQSQKINPILYGVATEAFFKAFETLDPQKADMIVTLPITQGYVKALVCTKALVEIMEIKPNNFGRLV